MGLFKKIKKAVKKVSKVVTSPTKLTTAVLTGGVSVVAPKLTAPITKAVGSTLFNPALFPALARAAAGPVGGALFSPQIIPAYGGPEPMALNLGGILGAVSQVFGQSEIGAFQTVGGLANIAGQFVPGYGMGQPTYQTSSPQATPVMASVPAIRAASALTREVFDAGVKVLQRLGISYPATAGGFSSVLKRALGSIASLARRTPAGTIVNLLIGLGLTSMEAYLLTAWHAQRKRGRRMNPANSKALRRAARRIKSFHKLCVHTDVLKGRGRSIVRRGACRICRKSPCRC